MGRGVGRQRARIGPDLELRAEIQLTCGLESKTETLLVISH